MMDKSLHSVHELCQRHFTDVLGCFTPATDDCDTHHTSDKGTMFKRKPKCQTKNAIVVDLCEDSDTDGDSVFESSHPSVVAKSHDGCMESSDTDQVELLADKNADVCKELPSLLPVFDVLSSCLEHEENISAHQAGALLRWMSSDQSAKQTVDYSKLLRIFMGSKHPLVSGICCRLLKRMHLSPVVSSRKRISAMESYLTFTDVVSYMILLQTEMSRLLENGRLTMNLLNAIGVLDCISAVCQDVLQVYCNEQRIGSQLLTKWSVAELRRVLLTIVSLANSISDKIGTASAITDSEVTGSNDDVKFLRTHLARVPQIVSVLLTMSVRCEMARALNVCRIVNEYWRLTDCQQRLLLIESVSSPKLRLEMCCMVLERHCDVSMEKHAAALLSLHDIFYHAFTTKVVIAAVAQQKWLEDHCSSVTSYCEEICAVLCMVACSYLLFQKETRGQLPDHDIVALQRLPDYADTVKKRLSEMSRDGHILNVASVAALDRISCLGDIYCVEP